MFAKRTPNHPSYPHYLTKNIDTRVGAAPSAGFEEDLGAGEKITKAPPAKPTAPAAAADSDDEEEEEFEAGGEGDSDDDGSSSSSSDDDGDDGGDDQELDDLAAGPSSGSKRKRPSSSKEIPVAEIVEGQSGDEVDPSLILDSGRGGRRGRGGADAVARPKYTAAAQVDSDEDEW